MGLQMSFGFRTGLRAGSSISWLISLYVGLGICIQRNAAQHGISANALNLRVTSSESLKTTKGEVGERIRVGHDNHDSKDKVKTRHTGKPVPINHAEMADEFFVHRNLS